MSYQLIFTPGQTEPVKTPREKQPKLEEMQQAVGGYIQMACQVKVDGLLAQVWVDEEGLLKGKPINVPLMLWLTQLGYRGQAFVGPALVLVGKKALAT